MRAPVAFLALAAALWLAADFADAAPRVPVRDDEVLERLPAALGDSRLRELLPLRAALARDPRDLRVAVTLARAYVEAGRGTGDPRYAGYAQAVLGPWWALPQPPAEVRLLRAILLQRVHRFDEALADLDPLIAANPRDGQTQLTRATILEVQGRHDEARRACADLRGVVPPLYALTCEVGVMGATGGLQPAYATLLRAWQATPDADAGTRAWVLGTLAELAERAGRGAEAEARYREALALGPDDPYLLAAFADFLLDRDRGGEVAKLLAGRERADALLLRLALAAQRAGHASAATLAEQLRARFEAAALRGDRVHLREEARYTLHLRGDAKAAVALALDNWKVQKEPADLLVLTEAAIAAGDPAARRVVEAWIERTGIEDVRITAALRARSHPIAATARRSS